MSRSSAATFCWVSPRTATLIIAILGIVIHLNTFSWLGSLSTSLPDVPVGGSPPPPASFAPTAGRFTHSAATLDQLIELPLAEDGTNKPVYLPEWVAEAKAYLKAQGLSFVPKPGAAEQSPTSNTEAAGSIKSKDTTYSRFELPSSFSFDDGAQDIERMQWEALRLVIGTLRWYILLSVLCCCAGVVGVLRSHLVLSRLFVVHSFLDFLLSTLSLLALAIVCTYPSVRAHLCDEFGSGELQAWLSNRTPEGKQPDPNLSAISPDTIAASGWETLLDGVFASENCEESFRTTLVPVLLIAGLCFTAVRLQCLFLVQRSYALLMRSKLGGHGYALSESGMSTPQEGGRERIWKESKLRD